MNSRGTEPQVPRGVRAGDRGRRLSSDPSVVGHIDDVAAALNLVDETAALVSEDIDRSLQEATDASDFDRAHQLLEVAESLSLFRAAAENSAKEWSLIAGLSAKGRRGRARQSTTDLRSRTATSRNKGEQKRADYGKVSPDQKTSQKQFRLPILEVLVDMGGSGSVSDVLQELEQKMGATFKPADVESIPSNPKMLRWCSTAQWTRQELVNDGLIGPSLQRGVWEISDAGRRFVKTNGPSRL